MGADNGGSVARVAVLRWAWRSYRREWRQQLLVVCLLTLSVAAAVSLASATYNTVGVREDAVFGSANHRFTIDDPRVGTLATDVRAAGEQFGVVDVVGEWNEAVPGSVDSVTYRTQDPAGPFSDPMLAALDGRYPTSGAEVAVTDEVASTFQLVVGESFALDGRERVVVGIVENPSDLEDEFALVAADEFESVETVTLLVGGTGAFDEVRTIREFGADHFPDAGVSTRGDVERVESATVVVGVAAIVLVLVSLVASAGFVAVAQRRLRQLGLLSAIGATQRHLRLVVVANGVLVGAIAAVAGAALGAAAWLVAAPMMESAAGFRIDALNLPWPLVIAAMAAALVTATAAAWWPARSVSRLPTTDALSGHPASPPPVKRSVTSGVVTTLFGLGLLIVAEGSVVLVTAGTVTAATGVLLFAPAAVTSLGVVAHGLPVGVRIAWRDLARYRARSGLALAAISLALGIPVAIVVAASAAEAVAPPGNLPGDQLLVWTRHANEPDGISPFFTVDPSDDGFAPYIPDLPASDIERARTALTTYADANDWSIVDLDAVLDPRARDDPAGRRAVTVARRTDIGYLDVALVYRADPHLLRLHGIDRLDGIASTAPTGPTEIVTNTDELWLANLADTPVRLDAVTELPTTYHSLPGTLAGAGEVDRRGWTTATVGWLLDAPQDVSDADILELREIAIDNGLLVEDREERSSLLALRWGATAAGAIVALAVLAMTVGLIRTEATPDTRLLVTTGATSTIQRSLTASTAGGLALLGALIGTLCAYLIVAAGYVDDRSSLTAAPLATLATAIVAVPVIAGIGGWIFAARPLPAIADQSLE